MPVRLIELRVWPQGAVQAVYAGAASDDTFSVEDETGRSFALDPLVELAGRDLSIDLLRAVDGGIPPWRLTQTVRGLSLALNADPALVSDHPVYTVTLAPKVRSVSLTHQDPLIDGHTPVAPRRRYRLSMTAGFGGMTADLLILVHDAEDRHIESVRRALSPEPGLHAVNLDFVTPDEAAGLAVIIAGRAGEAGAVLHVSPPSLSLAAEGSTHAPLLAMRLKQLERARERDEPVARLRAPLPQALLEGGPRRLTFRIRGADGEARRSAVFTYDPAVTLAKAGIDRGSFIRLAGRIKNGAEHVRLRVHVDGQPSTLRRLKTKEGRFEHRLPIGREHLDGRLHVVELREEESQAVLFATHCRTAAYFARWPVLQAYAQAPLSPESSPALPHHLEALRVWGRRAAKGEPIPPVSRLLSEVLAGPVKRPAYPPLTVPQSVSPRASVIVPAHGKFEMTYLCLCALALAPCEAPFEVIVVDDGSPDETARIEEMVSGVRVVRHEQAQGFIAACRDGASAARGEYLAFLNNDTEVTAGWLDELLGVFTRFEKVGLVGARLVYPDGRLQEAGGVVWGSGDPWNVGRGARADDPAFNYVRPADYVSGAAIITPKAVWEQLGGFDPAYAPAYFEDTDYAMKVRASGRRVVYAPQAVVYHYEGATSGTDKSEGAKRFQEINRPKFKQKWRALYAGGRPVGERVDLEKDRHAAFRVLVLPRTLAGIAAEEVQRLRALQRLGAKLTVLPLDLAWSGVTPNLERSGVEVLHAPFVRGLTETLTAMAPDVDLVVTDAPDEAAALLNAIAVAPPVISLGDVTTDVDALRLLLAWLDIYEGLDPFFPAAPPAVKPARAGPRARPRAAPRQRL
ncbi:MAG: glycosyltransferase family 2 protein [Caulobacteraceae bacterium]